MRWLIICVACFICLVATAQDIRIEQISPAEGVRVDDIRSIYCDSRGILWVGTYGDGVLFMKDGRFVHPVGANQNTGPYIMRICEANTGEILVRSSRGVAIYNGRSWKVQDAVEDVCPESDVARVLDSVDADLGTTFYATSTGLYSKGLLDENAARIEDKSGFLDDTIQALAFDRQDGLWIGTRNNGLLRRSVKRSLQCIEHPDAIGAVIVDGTSGRLWAIAGQGRLRILDVVSDSGYMIEAGALIRDLTSFGEGRVIVNDVRDRLQLITTDTTVEPIELARGIRAVAMKADAFGTAWIVDNFGRVHRAEDIEGGTRISETYASIPVDGLLDIYPQSNGVILAVYRTAVGELAGTRFRTLVSLNNEVTCAHFAENDLLWMGTADGNVLRYAPGTKIIKASISPRGTGLSRPLRFIHPLPRGLLVADDVSVYQLNLDDTGTRVEDASVVADLPAGGTADFAYGNGELLLASNGQLCRLPVEGSAMAGDGPSVYMRDILLPSGSISETVYSRGISAFMRQSKPTVLPYRENNLVFSWESVSSVPGETSYAYRLNDDEPWKPVGSSKQIQLVSLAPGAYAFELKACDVRMRCSTLDRSWQFVIKKPWWQLWWIRSLVAALVILFSFLVIRARDRRIQREAQRKVELANARARSVELEQKARQLQMRPHFMSNALNAIQSKLINGDTETASDDLVRFSRMMRSMLNSSRKQSISLEDDLALLREYIDVVGLAKGQTPFFEITSEEDIDTDDIEIPPMLLQPVIENAIEHGGPEIMMHINMNNDMLNIEVRDNGPGFEEGALAKESSVAMKLLQERLQAVGGDVRMYNAEDGGAVVVLEIPV